MHAVDLWLAALGAVEPPLDGCKLHRAVRPATDAAVRMRVADDRGARRDRTEVLERALQRCQEPHGPVMLFARMLREGGEDLSLGIGDPHALVLVLLLHEPGV